MPKGNPAPNRRQIIMKQQRIAKATALLRQRPYTIPELSTVLGCSEVVVRRYLRIIRETEYLVKHVEKSHHKYLIMQEK